MQKLEIGHCLAPLGLALIDHIMENRGVKYPCDPCDVIAAAEPSERGEKIAVVKLIPPIEKEVLLHLFT